MQSVRPSPIGVVHGQAAASLELADVREAASGDIGAFEALMRRHNRLVFRTVRSVVRSDAEAEDVAQEAWLAAFRHLDQFEGRSSFSTWLTRIALRIAFARIKQEAKRAELAPAGVIMSDQPNHPAEMLEQRRLREALERALDKLPLEYRVVLVLRDVEQRSTTETAESLGVTEENVRVRLHRSRAAMRALIQEDLGAAAMEDVFAFDGARCNRLTAAVLARLSRTS